MRKAAVVYFLLQYLGDIEKVKEYGELFNKGYKWTKENLFNGKHFIQKIDLEDKSIIDRFNAVGNNFAITSAGIGITSAIVFGYLFSLIFRSRSKKN